MTINEQGLAYFHEVEKFLKTPNLIIREDGTMNHQETAIIFLDKKSQLFASFENNSLYENHYFITSYEIESAAVNEFIRTGNIGESLETRKAKMNTCFIRI